LVKYRIPFHGVLLRHRNKFTLPYLVMFTETYVHSEIFSYDLSHLLVLFQWKVGLCDAATETNHTYSHVRAPYFLELVTRC